MVTNGNSDRLHFPGLQNHHGRRQWQPTPVLLPGKSHGRRSLVDCTPWGREESDTTKLLHFHFSLSCIGEGSGNPLQCSCLENPRDGGARWAAVYGVAQSRTRLKRLSSSSSSRITMDVACSHDIKRHMLFRRKAMMSLGSVLKNTGTSLYQQRSIESRLWFFQ